MAGGSEFKQPNYSDAVPPTPVRQGGMAQPNYVDEHTFESGQAPDARAPIESDWMGLVNTNGLNGDKVDGFHTDGVGGTYNPGNSGK
jgi:hypothetical protein